MSIKNMTKEDLELLSNKDITNLLLEEKGKQSTPDLFKKIIKLLDLPESTFDQKIGDYYTSLTTDKRFILLDNAEWDLKEFHSVAKIVDEEDEEEESADTEEPEKEEVEIEDEAVIGNEEEYDDDDDDLSDLAILTEEELEEE